MGIRSLHTCESLPTRESREVVGGELTFVAARALAIRASGVRRDATVAANETGGFKYIPGGRELFSLTIVWVRRLTCSLLLATFPNIPLSPYLPTHLHLHLHLLALSIRYDYDG